MYVSMLYYRVPQAEYSVRILVAVPQGYMNTYSTCTVGSSYDPLIVSALSVSPFSTRWPFTSASKHTLHIQYSYSCGCASEMHEYVFACCVFVCVTCFSSTYRVLIWPPHTMSALSVSLLALDGRLYRRVAHLHLGLTLSVSPFSTRWPFISSHLRLTLSAFPF